ncbi:MAG: D-aminoacyl-tRNA deacylase [Vicinamibacterales bacterium]
MRLVIQRVSEARVRADGRLTGEIGRGLLVLVGISKTDGVDDVTFAAAKIRELRTFDDEHGKGFDRSVVDVGGSVLLVSQFTLYGDCRKGRRPSFDAAASPDVARGLYESLVRELRASGLPVETGEFQATMQVELVNDGPVTLVVDSTRQMMNSR